MGEKLMGEKLKEGYDVRFCPSCKCETWHINGVCEWIDMHIPVRDNLNDKDKKFQQEDGHNE